MAAKPSKQFQCPTHWTLAQRLDHYTDKSGGPDACWPWTGCRNEDGYGQLLWQGQPRGAHRLAWIEKHGPIPPETPHVLHRCDNPPCRNESHLWLGTNDDNNADMMAKGRHGTAKLTAADVRAIRAATGMQSVIAARFGVTQANVSCIRSGKTWRHVL
jgi:hypothetical protein